MKSCSYARCRRLIAILGSEDGSLLRDRVESQNSMSQLWLLQDCALSRLPPLRRRCPTLQQQSCKWRSQSRVVVPATRGRGPAFASLCCYSLLSLLLYISWCLCFTAPNSQSLKANSIKLNFMTSKVRISSSSCQMDINNHGHG